MAKNNGVPDWQKMLDYNLIDHESKQRFLSEEKQRTNMSISSDLSYVDRGSLERFVEQLRAAHVNPERTAAEQEARYVKAALEKRFGSYQNAADQNVILALYRRKQTDGCVVVLDHCYQFMDAGTFVPLIDIRITMIHDEFSVDYTSHVGTLKL